MSDTPFGKIVVWGAGAIGGTIGAHLARAGHEVLFVDRIADHVRSITGPGLQIDGPISDFTIRAEAATPDEVHGEFRLILLAVKAQDTAAATRSLLPHLGFDGAVVSCQNGLNETVISRIVGVERTIGAFVNFDADWIGPGHITFGGRGTVVVGELDSSSTPRLLALHRMLKDFEPEAILSDNILGYLWGKVAYGSIVKASALTDATMAEFFASSAMRPLIAAIVLEVLRIAVAENVTPVGFQGFDPEAFLSRNEEAIDASMRALNASRSTSTKLRSGIWRDLVVRKREAEVAEQLVPVLDAARRHGLTTPILEHLVELIGAIERGERKTGLSLAEELRATALAA